MKTIKLLALAAFALALCGCQTLPGVLQKTIPVGTWKSIDATVGTVYGSAVVHADGVVNTGTILTATNLAVTISSPVQPILTVNAQGFALPSVVTPTTATNTIVAP